MTDISFIHLDNCPFRLEQFTPDNKRDFFLLLRDNSNHFIIIESSTIWGSWTYIYDKTYTGFLELQANRDYPIPTPGYYV